MISRRGLLLGAAAVAAPAIIRPGILMPVKRIMLPDDGVALLSIAHPDGAGGWETREISKDAIRHAVLGDPIAGVVVGHPGGGFKIFAGDLVTWR